MRALVLAVAALAVAAPAHAGQIEQPDRTVDRVEVRYAEPFPTKRHPNRHYFEMNDGSTFRFKGNRACEQADLVPDRVCHTVFWYAR